MLCDCNLIYMCYYALSLNNLNLIHTGIALRNFFFYLTQTTHTLLGLSEELEDSPRIV